MKSSRTSCTFLKIYSWMKLFLSWKNCPKSLFLHILRCPLVAMATETGGKRVISEISMSSEHFCQVLIQSNYFWWNKSILNMPHHCVLKKRSFSRKVPWGKGLMKKIKKFENPFFVKISTKNDILAIKNTISRVFNQFPFFLLTLSPIHTRFYDFDTPPF